MTKRERGVHIGVSRGVCLRNGAVKTVMKIISLGGKQGPNSVKGFPTRDADAQDLVQSRIEEETLQLNVAEAPPLSRISHGHLSKARNERLQLVDCIGREERRDQSAENCKLLGAFFVLTQSRRNQRVLQQLQPLLVAPFVQSKLPESSARTALR